jgi:hypothetical protein
VGGHRRDQRLAGDVAKSGRGAPQLQGVEEAGGGFIVGAGDLEGDDGTVAAVPVEALEGRFLAWRVAAADTQVVHLGDRVVAL